MEQVEYRGNVKMDEDGTLIVEIPELERIITVTPSYYKKHVKKLESDKAKIQDKLSPTGSQASAETA